LIALLPPVYQSTRPMRACNKSKNLFKHYLTI